MISLKNIYKSFGGQKVLENLSVDIPDRGRIAVMGRSGAGKTTLLNIIMGLEKPDSGEVQIPAGLSVGAVFQEDRLIESLNAVANCRIVLKDGRENIQAALNSLGITEELSKKPVSELSGGERRRVAIARSVLCKPDIIILDEPFKGIDAPTLPRVTGFVSEAAKGRMLILVTHSEDEAKSLGCNIVYIDKAT